jgi:hypothetical protein
MSTTHFFKNKILLAILFADLARVFWKERRQTSVCLLCSEYQYPGTTSFLSFKVTFHRNSIYQSALYGEAMPMLCLDDSPLKEA